MANTYDIIAFSGAGFDTLRLTTQSIFYSDGEASLCTGIQKLCQKWLLEFLTARGSMGFHLANRGTDFLRVFRERQFNSESDVRSQFNFASTLVYNNLISDWTAATPDDEKLGSAVLNGIVLSPGTLLLTVQITSVAGTSATFKTPITVLPALAI